MSNPDNLNNSTSLTPVGNADAVARHWRRGPLLPCVDGVWSRKDGDDPPTDRDLLVDGFDEIIQRWENNKPVETLILSLDGPLPNVDAMNAAIPKDQWNKIGSGGELSAPCQHSAVIYVVDPETAESYTIANSTWGMWICYEDIVDRIKTMCRLRGGMVKPIVRLSRRKMKTAYGVKQRPHLEVVRWVKFGNPTEAVTPPAQPALPAASTQPAMPVLEAKPATPAPATPPAKVAPSHRAMNSVNQSSRLPSGRR